jgi:hypothetical protein
VVAQDHSLVTAREQRLSDDSLAHEQSLLPERITTCERQLDDDRRNWTEQVRIGQSRLTALDQRVTAQLCKVQTAADEAHTSIASILALVSAVQASVATLQSLFGDIETVARALNATVQQLGVAASTAALLSGHNTGPSISPMSVPPGTDATAPASDPTDTTLRTPAKASYAMPECAVDDGITPLHGNPYTAPAIYRPRVK